MDNSKHFTPDPQKGYCSQTIPKQRDSIFKDQFRNLRNSVKNLFRKVESPSSLPLDTTLKVNPKRFWSVFKIKSSSGSVANSVSAIDPNNPETRSLSSTSNEIASMFIIISTFIPSTFLLLVNRLWQELAHLPLDMHGHIIHRTISWRSQYSSTRLTSSHS